ncbi:MAG: AraC family transcriptional regulator [Clostridiales bacterium]|nr:AraC family transcriptional regulator [Clostridiales bacterium]
MLHYDFNCLSKEIKRKTGKTYTQLVQDKRLAQAEFLLKNTSFTIDEVAARVGYNNISYFHRLFYRQFKISPAKYRKQNQ